MYKLAYFFWNLKIFKENFARTYDRSVMATQRAFRLHFNIPVRGDVPGGNAIRRWPRALENTGLTLTPSAIGRPRTVRSPENVTLVRNAIEQSPRRSARRHAVALSMSSRSLRRILHKDLQFHPYKMVVIQELIPRDFENRLNCCHEMLGRTPANSNIFQQ